MHVGRGDGVTRDRCIMLHLLMFLFACVKSDFTSRDDACASKFKGKKIIKVRGGGTFIAGRPLDHVGESGKVPRLSLVSGYTI